MSTSDESTNVARTIGTAPRRPAHPSRSCSRALKSLNAVDRKTATGRISNTSSRARASPEAATSGSWLREDEEPEDDEHRDLGEERKPFVEADELPAIARRRAADREADEVHGQEAAAPHDVGGAERDAGGCERRDRREGADGAGEAREDPRRREREDDSDHEAEPELADDEQDEVGEPFGVGALDPCDQPERERDRHRVVPAGLGLERTREPAPDLGEAQRREDRRRVGGRDDRTEQERLEPRQVEQRVRRGAGEERGEDDPDRAEQPGGHDDAAEPSPRRLEASLEEDEGEADDADFASELGVVELDTSRSVGAEQHPEREERDEYRHAGSRRCQRDEHARAQHGADDEENESLLHPDILAARGAA